MPSRTDRLVMHLDGDAFFVSVEMAKDPSLRGRPVVTGRERGIASALSYEAKRLGITRAMPIFQIRRQFPQVAVVDSDYEAYAVFSRRMMDIVRRYTDRVEEYSIDECFADFSRVAGFRESPRPTLERIKAEISRELGISVSLGLGPTKVIAKTASKSSKPDGLAIVPPEAIEALLDATPISAVWGIGSATAFALRKKGVSTALELARKPLPWVREHFSKPMEEMWHELNGASVKEVGAESEDQKSIQKTRSFAPASGDRSYVMSELAKNVERACRRARERGLAAREISVFLKTKQFSYSRDWCRLAFPTNDTFEAVRRAEEVFARLFDPSALYRATGVTLYGLVPAEARQDDLFGESRREESSASVFKAVDSINRRYGKDLVHIAESSRALRREGGGRGGPAGPRLRLPILGEAR